MYLFPISFVFTKKIHSNSVKTHVLMITGVHVHVLVGLYSILCIGNYHGIELEMVLYFEY